jgi:hypothetical protein
MGILQKFGVQELQAFGREIRGSCVNGAVNATKIGPNSNWEITERGEKYCFTFDRGGASIYHFDLPLWVQRTARARTSTYNHNAMAIAHHMNS